MIIISYDIEKDELRNRFSKFLLAYGRRIQYSVFEIDNSQRIINIIVSEIKDKFEKEFKQSDSVYIFFADEKKTIRFGYAKNEEDDLVMT